MRTLKRPRNLSNKTFVSGEDVPAMKLLSCKSRAVKLRQSSMPADLARQKCRATAYNLVIKRQSLEFPRDARQEERLLYSRSFVIAGYLELTHRLNSCSQGYHYAQVIIINKKQSS